MKSKSVLSVNKLFLLSLMVLSFLSEAYQIYIVTRTPLLFSIIGYLQYPMYLILIYVIIARRYSTKQMALFAIIGILLLYGAYCSNESVYLRGFLLIIAGRNVKFNSICKAIRKALTASVIISVILFVTGISNAGLQRRGYYGYGYVHPNIFAQILMLIIVLWMLERRDSLRRNNYLFILLYGAGIIFLTGSKTSAIIVFCVPVLLWFVKRLGRIEKKHKIIEFLLTYSQVIAFAITYGSAKLIESSSFVKALDVIFINRIFLNYYAITKYGISMFGQHVSLSTPGEIYNNIRNVYWQAATVDSTYTWSLVVMGLIPSIIMAVGYIYIIKRAIKNQDYTIVAFAVLFAIYGLFESQMGEIYNNFVYFYLTSKVLTTESKAPFVISNKHYRLLDG